jgi:hypothetical protein
MVAGRAAKPRREVKDKNMVFLLFESFATSDFMATQN